MIAVEIIPSPVGPLTLATRDGVVLAVEFERPSPSLAWLRRRHPTEVFASAGAATPAGEALAAYFTDADTEFGELRLDLEGSDFERRVWAVLRSVPLGKPSHRVIGADGSLTGFGGGAHRKQWLLDHESGGRLL